MQIRINCERLSTYLLSYLSLIVLFIPSFCLFRPQIVSKGLSHFLTSQRAAWKLVPTFIQTSLRGKTRCPDSYNEWARRHQMAHARQSTCLISLFLLLLPLTDRFIFFDMFYKFFNLGAVLEVFHKADIRKNLVGRKSFEVAGFHYSGYRCFDDVYVRPPFFPT